MDAIEDRTRRAVRAGSTARHGRSQPKTAMGPSLRPSRVIVLVAALAFGLGGSALIGWLAGGVLLAVS